MIQAKPGDLFGNIAVMVELTTLIESVKFHNHRGGWPVAGRHGVSFVECDVVFVYAIPPLPLWVTLG